MLPISQKDLYIHETTIGRLLGEHSTTTVLEETNQDSQHQGNQPIGRQIKVLYIGMLKTKRILQQTV